MSGTILPLVRGWAVDWLNARDPEAAARFLAPEYALRVGIFTIGSRAEYVEATLVQLAQYPGLVLTIHDVLTNGTQAAVRFSEHGVAPKHDGHAAAWTGVALFEAGGEQLVRCWAEEDYAGRRRQLASGVSDPVDGPAVAPWDTLVEPADPAAEAVVRTWLEAGLPPVDGVLRDDERHDTGASVLEASGAEVDVVMSAGSKVAFHGRVTGVASDGSGVAGSLGVAGLVEVREGAVVGGHVVSDRLGTLAVLKRAVAG